MDPDRPNDAHAFAVAMVGWNRRVLELGAASGHVTKVLAKRRCEVTAVERDPDAVPDLERIAHRVVVGDLNDPRTLDALEPGFDVVLAGDVLEHLTDPQAVLARAVRLLGGGGYVVISLPHVGHVDVRLSLLSGRWDPQPWGLLDATHLRFFTLDTVKRMLAETGLVMTELKRVRYPAFETELGLDRDSVSTETLEQILADPEAETYQFVLSAAVADGSAALASLAERNAELELDVGRAWLAYGAIEARVENVAAEREAAHAELEETRKILQRTHEELIYTQQQFQRVDRELAAMGVQLASTNDQLLGMARALQRVEHSVTWQAFQRVRGRLFALAGGEQSKAVRGLQAALRRSGRALLPVPATPAEPASPPVEPSPAPAEPTLASSPVSGAAKPEVQREVDTPSATACIVPWTNLIVRPDGNAMFCCEVPEILHADGRALNVATDSLETIWNADELVATRTALAQGRRPQTCAVCWKREAHGSVSKRRRMNDLYVAAGGTLDPRSMAQLGAATGYRLDRPPDWFTLELGNTCNLKCRSCDPAFSSKIAADPVQRAWAEERADRPGDGVPPDNRFAERAWARDISRTADMIASGASENAVLALLGGEPFLIKQTWELLEALVERNVARNIFAGISTNGQWRSTKLEELAPAFRGFGTSVSIDGYGRLFEYLRHGGRWDTLRGTLDWLTGLDCVSVSVTPTLQNTNALNMVRLFRALDTYDLTFSYNVLTWPTRLQPANLPPAIRSLAAQRLRDYLRDDCAPYNAEVVCGYAEVLEEDPDAFDEELFHEFMTFTNDLDDSRGERLADAAPELFDLIAEAGIVWTADRRHTAMTTP